jgi:ABC-type multidrug transport system ATPase subunit
LTPPTTGDCTVFGKSISTELGQVRQQLGVCPQTNVMFPSLTVDENLFFFARVKGVGGGNFAAMEKAVATAVTEVRRRSRSMMSLS